MVCGVRLYAYLRRHKTFYLDELIETRCASRNNCVYEQTTARYPSLPISLRCLLERQEAFTVNLYVWKTEVNLNYYSYVSAQLWTLTCFSLTQEVCWDGEQSEGDGLREQEIELTFTGSNIIFPQIYLFLKLSLELYQLTS